MAYDYEGMKQLCKTVKVGDIIRTNLDGGQPKLAPYIGEVVQTHNTGEGFWLKTERNEHRGIHPFAAAPASYDTEGSGYTGVICELVCPVELKGMDGKLMKFIMKSREATNLLAELAK